MSPARTITDEELLQFPKDGHKHEVVDGQGAAGALDGEDMLPGFRCRLAEVLE